MSNNFNVPFFFKKQIHTDNIEILNIKNEYYNVRKLTVRLLFLFAFLVYLVIAHGYYKANYPFMLEVTLVSLAVLILVFFLKSDKPLSDTLSCILFVYIPIANIFIKDAFFLFHDNPSIKVIFLHTHFMLLIFICFSGIICNHRHTLIVGGISIIWIWIFTVYLNDSFIWSLILLDTVFFTGISFIMYFVYTSIHVVILEFDKLGHTISRQNEELNRLVVFKDWMLNLIVHDLKNPINRILSAGSKDTIQKMEIIEPGKHILLMVENILNVSKMENSKITLNLSVLSMDEIILKATEQVKYLLDEGTITLVYQTTVKSTLEVDQSLMERVMINLLNNAIKFSKTNSCINIVVLQKNEMLRVEISDHGAGIKPGNINRIFDKYFQDSPVNVGFTHSSGVGLTFCKLVIEAHGGTIGADSVLNQGTTIWFELPCKTGNTIVCEEIIHTSPKKYHGNNQEDVNILKYKLKIAHLAVYQTGEILNIFKLSSHPNTPEFLYWKEEIIKSSMSGNTEYFNQLKDIPAGSVTD